MKNLLIFLLISTTSFAQNKKEQIEILNFRVDSLNTVLATTRDNSAKDISILNDKIKKVRDEVTALKGELTNLQTSNNKLTKENENLKLDLEELSEKILNSESGITSDNTFLSPTWEMFELDSLTDNFYNSFLLLTAANWVEVDGHYFDHYGAKKYSINNPRYSLISDYSGEGGSSSQSLYLMSGDNIILYFESQLHCEDYIDDKYSKNDRTSYAIVSFINKQVSFSYGEEKNDCGIENSKHPYKRFANPELGYPEIKTNVERILQFIKKKPTNYGE